MRRPYRRGRKSYSAPPQHLSSSPFAPPSSVTFDPELPVAAKAPRRVPRAGQDADAVASILRNGIRKVKVEQHTSPVFQEDEEVDEPDEPDKSCSDFNLNDDVVLNAAVSKALAEGGSARAGTNQVFEAQGLPFWARMAWVAMALSLLAATASYKVQSASIGFCYPGTDTNAILGERQAARIAAQECTERLAHQSGDVEASNLTCTPLPLLPLPEPTMCTPCPVHAYCTPDTVTCEPSFVLRQNPLAIVPLFSRLFDGLPGLGPVAFPPSCVEDEARKRSIGRLGVALENYLAWTRGHRLCVGVSGPVGKGGEATQLGLQVDRVRDHLKKVTVIQVCCFASMQGSSHSVF